MNDGILTQEEIDALLNGGKQSSQPEDDIRSQEISDFEKDTIGEIGNISMGTSATTLSTLLRRKVNITTPNVFITTPQQLQTQYPLPYVVVEVRYTEGIKGSNVFVVKEDDACVIADLMMGGDGRSECQGLDELQLSAVSEAMNQMMGSATTSLSSMFNNKIDISPPDLWVVDLARQDLHLSSDYDEVVQIRFKMVIEDLIDSEIMQIMPIDAAKKMIAILMSDSTEESPLNEVIMEEAAISEPEPVLDKSNEPADIDAHSESGSQMAWERQAYDNKSTGVKKEEQFVAQAVQFTPLQARNIEHVPQNIDLIMDVPLDVAVELGKTRKTIKEILELSQGSIIQLDKMAGEPVDLMVNGKLIAKGEVVVIDENYGIRITTILSPMDRMGKLQ